MIRLLKLEDYSTIFSLLSQLTSAPILDKIHYKTIPILVTSFQQKKLNVLPIKIKLGLITFNNIM